MFHKLERSQINKIRALVKSKRRVHLIPKRCKNNNNAQILWSFKYCGRGGLGGGVLLLSLHSLILVFSLSEVHVDEFFVMCL